MSRYENGCYEEEDDDPYVSGVTYTHTTGKIVFGRKAIDDDNYYGDFKIDEMKVFNYALDATDVHNLYISY